MPRTTPDLVRTVVRAQRGVDLTPFIAVASEVVTERCAGYLDPATGLPMLTPVRLELVERWLAAHFYQVMKPRATQEQADTVQASYQSKVDLGLNVTHYGQQAMLLDTTGGLAALQAGVQKAVGALPQAGGGQPGVFTGRPVCPPDTRPYYPYRGW